MAGTVLWFKLHSHTPVGLWRIARFKMLMGFLQIVSGFRKSYRVRWPKATADYMRTANAVNFDVFRLGSFDCIMQSRFYAGFGFLFLTPIVAAILFVIFYQVCGVLLSTPHRR